MLLILYALDSLFFATPKSKRVLMFAWRHMLLNRLFADSLFFATPKSKRVLMYVWRHMLRTLWFVDSLFFATPKSKRVLMPTKVGGEVHGEGQRKRKGARRWAWCVSILFFGFFALLVTRFSLPIRRVRG